MTWTIYPDGPDGKVPHFYADGNMEPVEVVSVREVVEALREQIKWHREAVSDPRASGPAVVRLATTGDVIEFTVLPMIESRFGAEGER